MRDANIYRWRSGTTSKHSSYVSVMVFRRQQYWSGGMQISIAGEVEQPPNTRATYQLFSLGSNKIGKQGYKMLKGKCEDIDCDWQYKQ